MIKKAGYNKEVKYLNLGEGECEEIGSVYGAESCNKILH